MSDFSDQSVPAPSPTSLPRRHLPGGHDDSYDPFTSSSGPFTGFISASTAHHQHPAITRLLPDSERDPEGGQNEGETAPDPARGSIIPSIGFASASKLVTPLVGFVSALAGQPALVTRYGSSSPPHMAFENYAETAAQSDSFGCLDDNPSHRPFSAFTSLGKQKNFFQPSAAAMKKAQEKEKRWAAEDYIQFPDLQDDSPEKLPDVTISPHQALQVVENVSPRGTSTGSTASGSANENYVVSGNATVAYNAVGLPSLGQVEARGTFQSAAYFSTPSTLGSRSIQAPSTSGIEGIAAMKPFKSPLLNPAASKSSTNPQYTPPAFNTVASTPTKPAGSFPGAVNTLGSRFSTPMPIRATPMRKVPTKKFVTPFKPGMRPGEPGHRQLKARYDAESGNTASGLGTEDTSSMSDGRTKPTRRRFFDLCMSCRDSCVLGHSPDVTRSGCARQENPGFLGFSAWITWSRSPCEDRNVSLQILSCMSPLNTNLQFRNVNELRDLSAKSALQHRFHVSPQGNPSADAPLYLRGPIDALGELKGAGCYLTTQEWVDNHWSLILWKLAGLAALDPESEVDVHRRRWSWAEAIRQLRYRYASPLIFYYAKPGPIRRYEKELNRGARPALRLITAQDVSTGFHMILCVSGIIWSGSGIGNDGLPLVPHPTFELTDGWYRLRARVDEVLARAARRGIIRVGRKISVSGASVRFHFFCPLRKEIADIHDLASTQHRTLRDIGGIRQSRTQHCRQWDPPRTLARQAWLPAAPIYSYASYALARRGDRTLSPTNCNQGMDIVVFAHGPDPDAT